MEESRKFIPGLVWYRPFQPFAFALIRFLVGALIAVHGVHRLFYAPVPEIGFLHHVPAGALAWFEIITGTLVAVGLLTRPVGLLLALEWLSIAVAVPVKPGASWLMLGATEHFPAVVAALCVAFLLRGGGHYSLDRIISREV